MAFTVLAACFRDTLYFQEKIIGAEECKSPSIPASNPIALLVMLVAFLVFSCNTYVGLSLMISPPFLPVIPISILIMGALALLMSGFAAHRSRFEQLNVFLEIDESKELELACNVSIKQHNFANGRLHTKELEKRLMNLANKTISGKGEHIYNISNIMLIRNGGTEEDKELDYIQARAKKQIIET